MPELDVQKLSEPRSLPRTVLSLVAAAAALAACWTLAGQARFIADPESLDSSDTLPAIWYAVWSLVTAIAHMAARAGEERPPNWMKVMFLCGVALLAALIIVQAGLATSFALEDTGGVTALAWLWVFAAHLTALATPVALIVDALRRERARAAGRRPPRLSITLAWTLFFAAAVLPWLVY